MRYWGFKFMQFSLPFHIRKLLPFYKKKIYNFTVRLDERAKYVQKDVNEQADWYKLCGVSFNRFDNLELTAMIAFRYVPKSDTFELSPYIHNHYSKEWVGGGGSYQDPDSAIPAIPADKVYSFKGGELDLQIMFNGESVVISIMKDEALLLCHVNRFYREERKWSWLITPYFGGTLPPPKKISLYLKLR